MSENGTQKNTQKKKVHFLDQSQKLGRLEYLYLYHLNVTQSFQYSCELF